MYRNDKEKLVAGGGFEPSDKLARPSFPGMGDHKGTTERDHAVTHRNR